MNIIKSSACLKSKPSENSALETECLFGETVEILDNYLNWVYCRLITDNYHGWIVKDALGYFKPITHRVIVTRSFIYTHNCEKSFWE